MLLNAYSIAFAYIKVHAFNIHLINFMYVAFEIKNYYYE